MNSATALKVYPGPTLSGGLNVWVGDCGGGGACEAGRAGGRVKGGVGMGCVGMGGVCGRVGGKKEGWREREVRRQLTA